MNLPAEAVLTALESLVRQGRDVVLQFDEEDGFWFRELARGHIWAESGEAMDEPEGGRRDTVTAAIVAAVEWNNAEAARPHSWRRRIDPTHPNA